MNSGSKTPKAVIDVVVIDALYRGNRSTSKNDFFRECALQ